MKDLIKVLEGFIEFEQVTELMKDENSVSFEFYTKQFIFNVYLEKSKEDDLYIMIDDRMSKLKYTTREKITNKHNITRLFIQAIKRFTKIRMYEFELTLNCNY